MHNSRISDFGALEQSMDFRIDDIANLNRSMCLSISAYILSNYVFMHSSQSLMYYIIDKL